MNKRILCFDDLAGAELYQKHLDLQGVIYKACNGMASLHLIMDSFTLRHFDEVTGEAFTQDYRWYYNPEGLIELEANAGEPDLPCWIFEAELENRRALSQWLNTQSKESLEAWALWEQDLA